MSYAVIRNYGLVITLWDDDSEKQIPYSVEWDTSIPTPEFWEEHKKLYDQKIEQLLIQGVRPVIALFIPRDYYEKHHEELVTNECLEEVKL